MGTLIGTFPQAAKPASGQRVELCRFTSSGTFDPAAYPTTDGLYDVYLVGGGGGCYSVARSYAGGGGGFAKLYTDLALTESVAVTIGRAGSGTSSGGSSQFGSYGYVSGGYVAELPANSGQHIGGRGGCGGAGAGGMGGVDGKDGWAGIIFTSSNSYNYTGVGGTGGGNVDYTPTNPYDGKQYGVGGNSCFVVYHSGGKPDTVRMDFPATNDNPGRGESYLGVAPALPGICIVYGHVSV